jgi:Protein of unknown function (DUF669)
VSEEYTESGPPEVLDLAGADLRGFDAIDSGRYDAKVGRAEWQKTKGGDNAKLPAGTPMLNIAYIIDGGEYDGRWVFSKYVLPPADYDEKKASQMKGSLARMLMALGYPEDQVTSGGFSIDLEDLEERECNISVRKRMWEGDFVNDVTGVRPRSAQTADSGLL